MIGKRFRRMRKTASRKLGKIMIPRMNPLGSREPADPNQRGSTIMLVTLILALTGIIALFIIYRVDAERLAAISMEQRLRYQQTAEAVLQRYLGLLVVDDTEIDNQKDAWYAEGRVETEENGYMITVIIEDEGSKPNLNLQDPDGLRFFMPTNPPDTPVIFLDPLLDWMDPDNDVRDKGAELDYYQELTPPYKPRNGFVASVEEIKAMKDGEKLYSFLGSELTVFGKMNPNVLDSLMFKTLLTAIGFEKEEGKTWVEKISGEFEEYRFRRRGRFNEIDDFLKNTSMLIPERDQLKPFLRFKGNCNLNFVSKLGLKAMIRQMTYQMYKLGYPVDLNPDIAEGIIAYRNNQPFSSLDTLFRNAIPSEGEIHAPLNIGDYFTLVSTIIRYRIWVIKGSGKYYLETLQERSPVSGFNKWEVHPLTWRVLTNNEVPEIPEPPEPTPSP